MRQTVRSEALLSLCSIVMLQAQRFELKYILDEQTAKGIRDFIFPYLTPDPFGANRANFSYPVHSLYFDSPDLKLHQSTINGERNRYKLRIRFYEEEDDAPVYGEIKRRENNVIYKERCRIKRTAVRKIIAYQKPDRDELVNPEPEQERSLENFCHLFNGLRAQAITHVSYLREAWYGDQGNRIRLTLDRKVMTRPEPAGRLNPKPQGGVPVFGPNVVLELKFTGRFPQWMQEMVRVFQLRQTSAAKYVDGLITMEERRLLDPHSLQLEPHRLPHLRRPNRESTVSAGERYGEF
ncbi:MAG: polyphosphate polymerase domain-containing protein [Opitutales bacterium]|nr:polyphosphate polymerase domain-containing protein [Opitutales bacterium]MCH8539824.1 polyphosphate polymerase domain-containing protein [Opitutales bacterium]